MAISNLLELTEIIERHEVSKANGAGEDIVYVYTDSLATHTEEITRAFVTYGETGKDSDSLISDVNIFYSAKLTKEPRRKDIIRYNGKDFIVDEFRKVNQYSKLYDFLIVRNSRNKKGREW